EVHSYVRDGVATVAGGQDQLVLTEAPPGEKSQQQPGLDRYDLASERGGGRPDRPTRLQAFSDLTLRRLQHVTERSQIALDPVGPGNLRNFGSFRSRKTGRFGHHLRGPWSHLLHLLDESVQDVSPGQGV